MRTICSTICLFFLTNLCLAQNNSFNGTFSNAQIGLTIILQPNNDGFSGQYTLQGQVFPITAQKQGDNTISGSYPYFGNIVPIQIMELVGNYILVTEGVTIPMTFAPAQYENNQPVITNISPKTEIINIPITDISSANKNKGREFK